MSAFGETLDRYLDHLRLERRLSPSSAAAYRSDLVQHLAFLETRGTGAPEGAQPQDLRDDLDRLARNGRSRASLQRYRSSMRGFYRFLFQEGWIPSDPSADVEKGSGSRRLPRALSRQDVEALFAATNGPELLDIRDRALIQLAYGTGLRVSELVTLAVDRIDLESRSVRVRGKGNRERIVPFSESVAESIARYIAVRRASLPPGKRAISLFLNRRGGPLSRMGFFRILKKRAARAGLDPSGFHPHLLRHSFATHMLQEGASLRFVQELLGHRSLATTEIYTAVDGGFLRNVHSRHHPRSKNDARRKGRRA